MVCEPHAPLTFQGATYGTRVHTGLQRIALTVRVMLLRSEIDIVYVNERHNCAVLLE